MTTTITGKNQITIPASIAAEYHLKPGTRIDWLPGDAPDEIRCRIVPDPATLAYELKGAGRKYLKEDRPHLIKELVKERSLDDESRNSIL
jgi:AbrB family looped-hinge helix DNA binding protein